MNNIIPIRIFIYNVKPLQLRLPKVNFEIIIYLHCKRIFVVITFVQFHNHCTECEKLGMCIGDYRENHCRRCKDHYFGSKSTHIISQLIFLTHKF
jgi:hypothetical protein